MKRRTFMQHAVAGIAAGTLAGEHAFAASERSAQRKPNIVYVMTDQWRAQATGYAGDPNVRTPSLDALAKQSANFVNAVSVCPVCTPHRASLLTGRYPLSTGMFLNDLYLPSEELCMAEIFKDAGYNTGYIGKWHLDGHGRDAYIPGERRQGFDYWKVLECTHNYNKSQYYAGDDKKMRMWKGYDAYAQTRDAQSYIREHSQSQKPFLLVMAYGGPHAPHHTAPANLKKTYPAHAIKLRENVPSKMKKLVQKEAQGYYAHCTALDSCVGDLRKTLDECGLAKNTIFVFTSDHGEMLGSQGARPGVKQRPYDESACVPFLISYPALDKGRGRRVTTPINTPDILPTLLSLSGISIPRSVEGDDLSGLVKGSSKEMDRAALIMSVYPFAGYHGGSAFRGIRTARYTYVRNEEGPWLLFDNERDPCQMKNLVSLASHAKVQATLERRLNERLKKTNDSFDPKATYLKEWGYRVDHRGAIPYKRGHKVQSPKDRSSG